LTDNAHPDLMVELVVSQILFLTGFSAILRLSLSESLILCPTLDAHMGIQRFVPVTIQVFAVSVNLPVL